MEPAQPRQLFRSCQTPARIVHRFTKRIRLLMVGRRNDSETTGQIADTLSP